jgi:DNA-binding helix-hairpin-helix protein with protein kinase domain
MKIYKKAMTADQTHKIQLLAEMRGQASKVPAAWPMGLVRNEQRQPVGLILPIIEGGTEVHQVAAPASRRQHFPNADWRFLASCAANLARAVHWIHYQGLVIGDINSRSFLVMRNATVRMIDVDSVQVPVPGFKPLLCTVAQEDFRPPELHNADLRRVIRTPNHDAFGLAVVLFQILLRGRHPYDRLDPNAAELSRTQQIAEHRFGFGAQAVRNGWQPPNTVGLDALPPRTADLFEAAFAPQATAGGRPSAETWVAALKDLLSNLVSCPRNATHQYARHLARCTWCAFEQRVGAIAFGTTSPPPASNAAQPSTVPVMPAEGEMLIRRIDAAPKPVPAAVSRASSTVAPSSAAVREGNAKLWRRNRKPWIAAYQRAKAEFEQAAAQLDAANRFPTYTAARSDAAGAKSKWNNIARFAQQQYQDLTTNAQRQQLEAHLKRCRIEDAKIRGIGETRIFTLNYVGITTAADVAADRLHGVPNFGPVMQQRLLDWRKSIERAFQPPQSPTLSNDALQGINQETATRSSRSLVELRKVAAELERRAAADQAVAERAARKLAAAIAGLNQAAADHRAAIGKQPQ